MIWDSSLPTDIKESRPERELRETRDMLGTLIRASPLAIVVLNSKREVLLWNDAAEALFGWTEQEVLGKPLKTIPEQYREKIESGIAASLSGESGHITDGKRLRKDGSLVDVQGWIGPHCNSEGKVIGAVGMFADATDRLRMRALDQRQQEELAHLLRVHTVGEVATTLAHELNQPLGAIMNFAGVALDNLKAGRCDSAMLQQTLEEIVGETNRADQIIRRVRSFVRKQTSSASLIDINEVAREAIKLVASRIDRAGVDLRVCVERDLPQSRGDAIHIAQIVVNLLTNAVDALADSPADRRGLSIFTTKIGNTAVELRVVDQGRGVKPELIEKLFEPFYTTRADGLGMGLAISRTLAEAHGGQLRAETVGEGGMTFILTLPRARERTSDP